MVKVISQKGRIAAAHGRFSDIRPVAPVCIPPNTWFLVPTRLLNPNGISIGSAVVAGLTTVADRQTDRQTDRTTWSVTIGRIYIYSTVMWAKNVVSLPVLKTC